MDYELISDDDYDTLPPEPDKRFAAIERICRKNMMAQIANESYDNSYDSLLRTQYMTIVEATAEELGIEGIRYVNHLDSTEDNLREFIRQAAGVTAKIRLRNSSGRDALYAC
ncbi:hypothetical protein [Rhizobium mesoamericanum]|uniref:hypothetical protein n=1 Tax=Rhizobium mesoamericanum TaxID=1079800 RepID=UPI00040DB435|nr:hypothetical protein [Rhizobium mesoamericanum]